MNETLQQKQVQLCISADVVMNNFCYAYANALLIKLEQLLKDSRVCGPTSSALFSDIGSQVYSELKNQVGSASFNGGTQDPQAMCLALISHAKEFLAIFEKK
jgi:hypothetical protein